MIFQNGVNEKCITVRKLCHHFNHGTGRVEVLRGIDLDIWSGDFLAIMGSSGSGKSTLLHIMGCLLKPTSGSYLLNGRNILHLDEEDLARLRASTIAHVFQNFHLLPEMTVMENVLLPFLYNDTAPEQASNFAREAILQVGLEERFKHKPRELSGGEKQRVAIARALVTNPALILADEPTGNLDKTSSAEVLSLFQQIHNQGRTIIMVTHDRNVADLAQTTLYLRDGIIDKTV